MNFNQNNFQLTNKGKIENFGFCSGRCFSKSKDYFGISKLHLLTENECKIVLENCPECTNKYVDENNICTGKKIELPVGLVSFTRRKKRRKKFKAQIERARNMNIAPPIRFQYRVGDSRAKHVLVNESYPYDWYLGGDDSCHGDVGGPLIRNIKLGDQVRAVQIGILSRSAGPCGAFNSPLIYTRISSVYDWIEETVTSHVNQSDSC